MCGISACNTNWQMISQNDWVSGSLWVSVMFWKHWDIMCWEPNAYVQRNALDVGCKTFRVKTFSRTHYWERRIVIQLHNILKFISKSAVWVANKQPPQRSSHCSEAISKPPNTKKEPTWNCNNLLLMSFLHQWKVPNQCDELHKRKKEEPDSKQEKLAEIWDHTFGESILNRRKLRYRWRDTETDQFHWRTMWSLQLHQRC